MYPRERRNNNELSRRRKSRKAGEVNGRLVSRCIQEMRERARYVTMLQRKTIAGACEGSSYKAFSVTDRMTGNWKRKHETGTGICSKK